MNMKSNQYQEFRKDMVEFLRRDIVGPTTELEVIEDAPTVRYSAGILFPQQVESTDDGTGISKELDTRTRDEEAVGTIEQATSFFPSAMGLSFSVSNKISNLEVEVDAAKYAPLENTDFDLVKYKVSSINEKYADNITFTDKFEYKDGYLTLKSQLSRAERDNFLSIDPDNRQFKNALYKIMRLQDGWKRLPINHKVIIDTSKSKADYLIEKEKLKLVVVIKPLGTNKRICTVSLINTAETAQSQNDHKSSYFQTSIKIADKSGQNIFEDMGKSEFDSGDPEEKSLKLLFRNKRFFATGHGCSAEWESTGSQASQVRSVTIPSHLVPQMSFDINTDDGKGLDLRMASMAYDDKSKLMGHLNSLVGAYEKWIDGLSRDSNQLDDDLLATAKSHIELCKEAATRMRSGIAILDADSNALRAFNLANEAMLMQRTHTFLQATKKFPDEATKMPEKYDDRSTESVSSWRPFQTAFILMGLESLANDKSSFKDIVDLIWFPTGGGKTEAYLGLTAFTIFYRRLTNSNEVSGGTTVLMRYTLRLLTSQQFQRANTLICACEKIRVTNTELGDTPISIGLWLGSGSTPNTIKDAEYRLSQLILQKDDSSSNNPFQVLSCPWCGTHMVKKNYQGVNGYRIRSHPSRFVMWCPNRECDFHDELPISVIDEDVYRTAPTLLFGTVDKFAMLPWKSEAAKIFALDEGNPRLSPELVIQDELHLISGSLGTMVGLYESAIDIMCSAKGRKPKIIASTATIRRAKEQCNALYAREVRQFPSPGLNSEDSFFAREAEINSETPGRQYIGIMPSGKTSTTMQVRLMANNIQGAQILAYPDEVKDKYWTQVIYCNSIRELGSSKSIIYDDVKEYSSAVADRYQKELRKYSDNDVQELTSRIPAELIPEILQRLTVEYPNKGAIDTLLATNMISVGVDIDRLGIMLILGQPKTTSEYIQASSRVGRKYPGLVVTLYSPVKSRDRSHFEQFKKYHQSLYRYVEPTSVTPFSAPVRDKALHAVIIMLVRHYLGFETNKQLAEFNPNSEKLKDVINLILERVNKIDSAEVERTKIEIEKVISTITDISQLGEAAMYGPSNSKDKTALMRSPTDSDFAGRYSTPQSMRSTDVECVVRLDHSA